MRGATLRTEGDESNGMDFHGCKVFSATRSMEREELANRVNDWLKRNRSTLEIVDCVVRLSSDREFHCLTFVLFYVRK